MQVAGCVDDGYVVFVVDGVMYCFKSYGGGIGIYVFVVKVVVYFFGLDFQLVDCCGMEGICCVYYYIKVLFFILMSEFIDSGCFVYFIYFNNENDSGRIGSG